MNAQLALHGFASGNGGYTEFRFGIASFISFVWSNSLASLNPNTKPWPFRPIDDKFSHLHHACRHLAFKLERAASLYASYAKEHADALLSIQEEQRRGVTRQYELSLLLDAVILYLRIIPDVVATATPYFFSNLEPGSRSFRAQVKYFTKTEPGRDLAYSRVLGDCSWFDELAGHDNKGIRDLVVHRFAAFQFPVTTEPIEYRGQVGADYFTDAGHHGDLSESLPRIAKGLFQFLDAYVMHFNEVVRSAAGWAPLSHLDGTGCGIWHFKPQPESSWLIPAAV